MANPDETVSEFAQRHYRNGRGVVIGLRCVFADAAPLRTVSAARLGLAGAHGFEAIRLDMEELLKADGSIRSAWNTAQRALFRPGQAPPDVRGLFKAYDGVLQEVRQRYSTTMLDIDARAKEVQFGLYREYNYLLKQAGNLRSQIRLIDRVSQTMGDIAERADRMNTAGEIAFLRAFTPDMRRAGLVPA